MIGCGAAGWALESFLGWRPAMAVGLLVGFVIASLMPGRSCSVGQQGFDDSKR